MKIRHGLLALALVVATAASAAAAALKVVSFTGPITIKSANGATVTIQPGQKVPALMPGDQITVVSGQATFESRGVMVKAESGAAFAVSAAKDGTGITCTAGSVSVRDGKVNAVLKAGDAVTASKTLTVTAGTVTVTTAEGATQQLSAGQSVPVQPQPVAPISAVGEQRQQQQQQQQQQNSAVQETKTVSGSTPSN